MQLFSMFFLSICSLSTAAFMLSFVGGSVFKSGVESSGLSLKKLRVGYLICAVGSFIGYKLALQ